MNILPYYIKLKDLWSSFNDELIQTKKDNKDLRIYFDNDILWFLYMREYDD